MQSIVRSRTVVPISSSISQDYGTAVLSTARLPHLCRNDLAIEREQNYSPPETWYAPRKNRDVSPQFVLEKPGRGYVHAVTIPEIQEHLSRLPAAVSEKIVAAVDVVKLSGRTKKNEMQNLYGLQWGSTVYLYPFNETLRELYVREPRIEDRIRTERYGGQWTRLGDGSVELSWTREALRDFYLCEVLMHEVGHALDTKNVGFRARERFADAFATEFGYVPWRAQRPTRPVSRRHDFSESLIPR